MRKDGSKVPVLVGAARLSSDPDDLAFFILDVSERRRAEERIRQAERMEVVGQLAGGMAHEANNQMSVVLGATEFILRRADVPTASTPGRRVHPVGGLAPRPRLHVQLLAFSRRQVLQPQAVDLNQVVKKLEPILRRTLTETHRLGPETRPQDYHGPGRSGPARISGSAEPDDQRAGRHAAGWGADHRDPEYAAHLRVRTSETGRQALCRDPSQC